MSPRKPRSKKNGGDDHSLHDGANYDAGKRSRAIRDYYAERLRIQEGRAEDNAKWNRAGKKNVADLKALGIAVANTDDGFRHFELKHKIETSDKPEERKSLQRTLEIAMAESAECLAAAHDVGQLDFNAMLETGAKAKEAMAKEAGTAKVTDAE